MRIHTVDIFRDKALQKIFMKNFGTALLLTILAGPYLQRLWKRTPSHPKSGSAYGGNGIKFVDV